MPADRLNLAPLTAERIQPLPTPVMARATVIRNDRMGSDYWSLSLDASTIAERAQPGQFAMLTVARQGAAVPILPRPMALYQWDRAAGSVEIVYRVVGEGTQTLTSWRQGERMTVVGPLGTGFQLSPNTSAILLLGRGIGTCSLVALAKDAVNEGISVCAVASGRNSDTLVGSDLYRRIGASQVFEVSDDNGSSDPGVLRARLIEALAGHAVNQIFVCGSRRLLRLGAELAQQFGAEVQVSIEAHMACGLGYCHGCSSGAPGLEDEGPLVCTTGPVFGLSHQAVPA